ncbi:hypothetical protein VTL71DRAFT_7428 [Oculimacula yallundae]|uniref:Cytochrome P450 n=1 Tax=Oculimacula yallundae TaxID=86028 RepID=A0ABR4BU72_9HELO
MAIKVKLKSITKSSNEKALIQKMVDTNSILMLLASSWIAWAIYMATWRIYFSPLAKFPGPKLAAATLLYEMYYEIVKGGQYMFIIRDMHEKYGPIIRINPWELHINDPEYYNEIYAGGSNKVDKWPYHCNQFGVPDAALSTVSHDLHRLRRAPMNRLFSKASINNLEPLIQSTIDGLTTRLRDFEESKEIVTMTLAWNCLTMDIISAYAFGKSYNHVQTAQGFSHSTHEAMDSARSSANIIKQIPWAVPLMKKIPMPVMRVLLPRVVPLFLYQDDIQARCQKVIDERKVEGAVKPQHQTIFHEILASNLPPREKTVDRLMQEGHILIGAGAETTAWTLSVIVFHVLSDPDINSRLKVEMNELVDRSGRKPSLTQLEQLPYLSAIISEGLRLSFGITAHLQRVSPDQALIYGDWTIPAGTPVSMTSYMLHLNPKTFPDPHAFIPERWIENPRLSKYLVSFSKGSRQCLGINLAYAEMYLCIFEVWTAFPDMKLVDTTEKDVEVIADYISPISSGRGVKVLLS